MSYNGSGTYSLPAGNPVTTGTTITSTWANTTLSDIASALSNVICKDGQTTPTANIKMGGFKIINVAAGTAATDNANVLNVQNATGQQLGTIAGTNTITATGSPTLTAYASGQLFSFIAAGANTGATTLNIDLLGAKSVLYNNAACIGGEIASGAMVLLKYDGTSFHLLTNYLAATIPLSDATNLFKNSSDATKLGKLNLAGLTTGTTRTGTVPDSDYKLGSPRGYVDGVVLSTAGSSATFSVAAGIARDSTNVADLTLSALTSKTTSAWAVGSGNGALDTGAIANSTWYHVYLIMRADTGLVDILISLSASAPTMPANYTYKRRIGSMKTNGSAQWTSFTQDGDYFRWAASIRDVASTNPGTAAASATLTVPTGVNVQAIMNVVYDGQSTNNQGVYLSDLAATDEAIGRTTAPLATVGFTPAATTGTVGASAVIRTNTSAQIRYRGNNASGASDGIYIATLGWWDYRGRNS